MNQLITTRGFKKTSMATCVCKNTGVSAIRINKVPLGIHTDKLLVGKIEEILCLVGEEAFEGLEFDIAYARASSHVGNIYAARQALCKALLAYYSTFDDEYKKQEIKKAIMSFDRYAIVADSRKKEPKKYGGPGARARYQKSYR